MDNTEKQPEDMAAQGLSQTKAIPSALEEQQKVLSSLGDRIEVLTIRLQPALSLPTPSDPEINELKPNAESLVGTIQERTDTVRRFRNNIDDLINRIEL